MHTSFFCPIWEDAAVIRAGSPPIRFGDDTCLINKSFWKLASSQVALPQPPDVSRGRRQFPGTRSSGVRIDERDSKADAIPDVSHCAGKIGVVGYDDRLLVIPVEPIDQETRGEVHVRPLFLRVSDEDVRGQPWHGFDQRTAFDPGPEGTIVDLQTGCDVQRSEVDQLTLACPGLSGRGWSRAVK